MLYTFRCATQLSDEVHGKHGTNLNKTDSCSDVRQSRPFCLETPLYFASVPLTSLLLEYVIIFSCLSIPYSYNSFRSRCDFIDENKWGHWKHTTHR